LPEDSSIVENEDDNCTVVVNDVDVEELFGDDAASSTSSAEEALYANFFIIIWELGITKYLENKLCAHNTVSYMNNISSHVLKPIKFIS
jgi:hypothetical protein